MTERAAIIDSVTVDGVVYPLAELRSLTEVAAALGRTRQYVWNLANRRAFPEPVAEVLGARYWTAEQIEHYTSGAWAAERNEASVV